MGLPEFLPFEHQSEFLSLGARRIPTAQWIPPTPQLARYHSNKLSLAEQQRDILRSCAGSELAQQELQALLADHLLQQHAETYQREREQIAITPLQLRYPLRADAQALWQASLWIADDICLLQREPRGWVLKAASLCAPSHWQLADKIDRPLAEIHAPVPGLQQRLGQVIDRSLDKLAGDEILERGNWSITDCTELAQFDSRQELVTADQPLFLRVERQSLRKLPASAAIAFTIRVDITPLDELGKQPAIARQLLEAVNRRLLTVRVATQL